MFPAMRDIKRIIKRNYFIINIIPNLFPYFHFHFFVNISKPFEKVFMDAMKQQAVCGDRELPVPLRPG